MSKVKEYKAEAFDIMQYFYSAIHEPRVRCSISFSANIDEVALKKAVTISLNFIPLLKCIFDATGIHPCWKDIGFTGEDIVHVIEAGTNPEDQKTSLLATTIDIAHEPQLKLFLLREQTSDTLCIIINHMVCDGSGFKEYLYLLSDLYTKCKNNVNIIPNKELPSRSTSQLFHSLNIPQKLGVLFSKYNLSKQKEHVTYSLQGDNRNPLFLTLQITKEEFTHLKAYGEKQGVTINDLILTAYARVLHRETGNNRIVFPCPVDLRKYLVPNGKHGICNLTSNFICDVTIENEDSFEATLTQVSNQMNMQKSSKNCLKSVVMLELAFHILPFSILKKVFHKIFTIPITSFTNLGVLDQGLLSFGDALITNAYLTGAIRHAPYFQIAVSSYENECTLSSNFYGTSEDKIKIEHFLMAVKKELSF